MIIYLHFVLFVPNVGVEPVNESYHVEVKSPCSASLNSS